MTGNLRQQGQELEARCPFHEDTSPSFYVNLKTGAWICHAGCGQGDFLKLLHRLESLELPKRARSQRGKGAQALGTFLGRGITAEIMQRWNIRYNVDMDAMEIPVHDRGGQFVGYIWRMAEGELPKYRYPQGFLKAQLLFGLHRARAKDALYLTEGPLDAIWLREAGISSAAILGSQISSEQVRIIASRPPRQVVLCFDNDAGGALATHLAVKLLREQGMWVYQVLLPAKYKDVQEIPLTDVPALMKDRHLCIKGAGIIHSRYRRWLSTMCS